MRAALGVQALLGHAQPFHRPSADQVLGDNLRCVFGPHIAVPDCLRVNHHHGPMFALVQAAGFVDAHPAAQPGGLGQLLQLRVQIAFSIGGAGRPGRVRGACVVADKDVAFECGQAVILPASRVKAVRGRLQRLPLRSFHN